MERRITCLYHQNQVITNFCKEKSCLMPLCPTCIREHSQYHLETSTKPQYYNIQEIIEEVHSLLYNDVLNLEQDRKRNAEIIKKIQTIEAAIKEKLSSAKRYIFQLLEQAFVDLEGELQQKLHRVNSEQGLLSIQKAQKVNEKLANSLSDLYQLREGLKSDKLMGSTIVFFKDKHPEITSLHNSLASYLQNNESYVPRIEFNNESKNQILHSLSKLIKIQGRKDGTPKHKDKSAESRSIFKSRGVMKEQITKNHKLEKSYTPEKSTNYCKSNLEEGKTYNYLHNNSPYRQKLSNTLKPSKTSNLPVYQVAPDSYRGKQHASTEYNFLSKRTNNFKKEGEAVYKYID